MTRVRVLKAAAAVLTLSSVLILSACSPRAVDQRDVERYVRAVADGDLNVVNQLSYAEPVQDVDEARSLAFGSSESITIERVKVGTPEASEAMGELGDGIDVYLVPVTVFTADGRRLEMEVDVVKPPQGQPSIGPAELLE